MSRWRPIREMWKGRALDAERNSCSSTDDDNDHPMDVDVIDLDVLAEDLFMSSSSSSEEEEIESRKSAPEPSAVPLPPGQWLPPLPAESPPSPPPLPAGSPPPLSPLHAEPVQPLLPELPLRLGTPRVEPCEDPEKENSQQAGPSRPTPTSATVEDEGVPTPWLWSNAADPLGLFGPVPAASLRGVAARVSQSAARGRRDGVVQPVHDDHVPARKRITPLRPPTLRVASLHAAPPEAVTSEPAFPAPVRRRVAHVQPTTSRDEQITPSAPVLRDITPVQPPRDVQPTARVTAQRVNAPVRAPVRAPVQPPRGAHRGVHMRGGMFRGAHHRGGIRTRGGLPSVLNRLGPHPGSMPMIEGGTMACPYPHLWPSSEWPLYFTVRGPRPGSYWSWRGPVE
ncbi:pollen-specific leucine-rich repeat extensin-like protein 2 [Thrips palmi]|uniref:Pollen-specific leucine-rich repeat extensin-like protein 2 n=1 Tax=Thrips palmi TaxID=161013 RepID=A0A6P8ZQE4_THRPL|nr:pollen-specific leucine-rich repeat extensin-like protein 2 [Thrips palmi]